MDIRNFTQFANLLTVTQTIHTNPCFGQLVTCMQVYNSMCNCGGNSNQEKSNKQAECNRIYRSALSAIDSIKANLFQKCADNHINFYINDLDLIKSLCR